jgi:hypothetical protein
VRALPREAPRSDAAFRALAAATSEQPQGVGARLRWRRWIAAAACIAFIAGVAVAYRVGFARGLAFAPAPSHPPSHPPPRPAEVGPVDVAERPLPEASSRFARAACGVLADLVALDEITPELRVPLIGTQLQAFDLPAWAAREGAADEPGVALVSLVRELDEAVVRRDPDALLAVQRRLVELEPLTAAPQPPRGKLEVPRFSRTDAYAACDDFSELTTADCASLAELLQSKAAWIDGDLDRALQLARRDSERLRGGPLRASWRTLFVVSAGEAGELDLARQLLAGFDGELAQPLAEFLRAMRWTKVDGKAFSIDLSFGVIHRKGARDRDETIDPASGDGDAGAGAKGDDSR